MVPALNLQGRVALVTGAGRGIGAAIAQSLAQAGALVVVNYLSNAQAAAQVEAQCQQGGGGWAYQADVTDASAVQAMVQAVLQETGRIDVLVNNAFAPYRFNPEQRQTFAELTWADMQTQLDGALRSSFALCQAVLPAMRSRGQGSIINISSDLVLRPSVPYHDYTTAKSALEGMSRNLAQEVGPLGVRVNCVAPGLVYPTDASRDTPEAVKDMLMAQTPMRRLTQPQHVAGAVLFLASDLSAMVTGQVLTVDGGLVMR
jgi:3-oxoacyl-[acyl-carrier protein] reductase